MRAFALLCFLAFALIAPVWALELAVVSAGTEGDLLRIASVVQAAQQRRHAVVVLVESAAYKRCESVLGRSTCAAASCPQGQCRTTSRPFGAAILTALRARSFVPKALLASAFLEEADAVGEHFGAPLIVLAGNAEQAGINNHTSLTPFSGSAEQHPLWATFSSALRGLYADVKDVTAPQTSHDLYRQRHVVVPGIPGLDTTGVSCPNVHSVGFLHTEVPSTMGVSADFDRDWLETCSQRLIVVDSQPSGATATQHLLEAIHTIANQTSACVLWRSAQSESAVSKLKARGKEGKVRATREVSAAALRTLSRKLPIMLISDPVADVLHTAVLAAAPVLVLQGDAALCTQVRSATLGNCTQSLMHSEVVSAAVALYANSEVAEAARALNRMGFLMGGAAKTVSIVEMAALLGRENADFVCDRTLLVSPYGYSIRIVLVVSALLGLVQYALLCICAPLLRRLVRVGAHERSSVCHQHKA